MNHLATPERIASYVIATPGWIACGEDLRWRNGMDIPKGKDI